MLKLGGQKSIFRLYFIILLHPFRLTFITYFYACLDKYALRILFGHISIFSTKFQSNFSLISPKTGFAYAHSSQSARQALKYDLSYVLHSWMQYRFFTLPLTFIFIVLLKGATSMRKSSVVLSFEHPDYFSSFRYLLLSLSSNNFLQN